MAITSTHYRLLRDLKPILPHGGKLLEIGEANWYGDFEPDFVEEYTSTIMDLPSGADSAVGMLLISRMLSGDLFAIAKAFYAHLFAPSFTHAVDMNGTAAAFKQDLNRPLRLAHSYDVVINHGTAEHVFNIAQVFKSMHDACKVGGLLIHDAPFTGWIDHGFYCLQPTLFYDLAAVNGYDVVKVAVHDFNSGGIWPLESRDDLCKLSVPPNASLFVVLRKTKADDFKLPMQGYYDGTLSDEGRQAWETRR